MIGEGLPLYTIERIIKELNHRYFGDESHIIYVNGEKKDDSPLGRLMQDFFCKEAGKMNYKELAERVSYFKNDDGGMNDMCSIMDELWQDAKLEGIREGKNEEKITFALNMIYKNKYDLEEISELTGLSIEKVRELAAIHTINT